MSQRKINDLLDTLQRLDAEVAATRAQQEAIKLTISQGSCPVSIGDRVTTIKGLGVDGAIVKEIVGVPYPRPGNLWAVKLAKIGKDGNETNRVFTVSEHENILVLPQ